MAANRTEVRTAHRSSGVYAGGAAAQAV